MKRSIILFLLSGLVYTSLAQLPQKPTGKPGQPNLPTPRIVTPADLVTSCGNVSVRTNTSAGMKIISVKVTVSNKGGAASMPIKLKGLVREDLAHKPNADLPPTRYYGDTRSIGQWKYCIAEPEVESIPGGGYSSMTYEFELPVSSIGNEKYLFVSVLADYHKTTAESNENNNMSVPVKTLNR